MGSSRSFDSLIEALRKADTKGELLLHASTANSRLGTLDGVESGGKRLAARIRELVEANSATLREVSLVGVSLGGLYIRVAAKELYDAKTGLICGLQARHFVTLATPHIGVGHSLGAHLQFASWCVGSQTAVELLGWDNYAKLEELASDAHLDALDVFEIALFANMVNDARVDYSSAALLLAPLHYRHAQEKVDNLQSEIIGEYRAHEEEDFAESKVEPYEDAVDLAGKTRARILESGRRLTR